MKLQQSTPSALFTIGSAIIATIGAFLTLVPVIIVNAIYAYIQRPNYIKRNSVQGKIIRNICLEMGVSSVDYNRIVISRMDFAKQMALKMGEPGGEYSDESWNTRLAYAIVEIYNVLQNQAADNPHDI